MGNARLYEIMKEKEEIYAKEDFTDEDGIKASELEAEFATMDGWEAESDAANLLNGPADAGRKAVLFRLCRNHEARSDQRCEIL